MLRRTRKRSARITLVLLGAASLAACDDQTEQRDLYASKQDCVQDWGDETKCEPAPASATNSHSRTGGTYFWGPIRSGSSYRPSTARAGSGAPNSARSGGRSIGSTSVSRGGFGSSASSHSSSGS